MPRHANPFTSHLRPEDPRGPLTAGAGCIWPTVPAHRYLLYSHNPSFLFQGLQTQGVLIQKTTPGPAHDACQWSTIAGPIGINWVICWKRWVPATAGYDWEITMSVIDCGIIQKKLTFPQQKCNVDFLIGNIECPYISEETGDTFAAYQVEFDKTQPPTFPPPPL